MKKPSIKTLILGHPLVATPLTFGGGAGLFVSLFVSDGGNERLIPALLCGGVAFTALRANEEAGKYRRWKAEWDAMGDGPEPRAVTPGRVLGAMLVAVLFVVAVGMRYELVYMASYAAGWVLSHPVALVVPALVMAAILFQFVRYYPRRAKPTRPVTVIAKPALPVPTLADAYRALPPYCHALMQGRP